MRKKIFTSKNLLPPIAAKHPLQRQFHGIDITDNYAWLKADNWQEVMKNPTLLPAPIANYLTQENEHSAAWLKPYEDLQQSLIKEMRGRIKEDESSVPTPDGPYAYYRRYRHGGEHAIFCRSPREEQVDYYSSPQKGGRLGGGLTASTNPHPGPPPSLGRGNNEQVLIDGDAQAAGKDYFQFGSVEHSTDHSMLAWSYDDKGSEFYTIAIRDVATGQDLKDRVFNTSGNVVWQPDGKAFYYVRVNAEHRPQFVYRHVIGTPAEQDEKIYEENDAGFFVSLSGTLTHRYAVINCHDHETSECWLIDLKERSPPRCIAPRLPGRIYSVTDGENELFILTNAAGAEDFKIMTVTAQAPQLENWRELVAAEQGLTRLGILATKDHLVRLERSKGLPRLVVRQRASGKEHMIAFSEEAYALGLKSGLEYDTRNLRFAYASPTTPTEIWDYDMGTRKRELRKRETIPSGHNRDDYIARRLFAKAPDGEDVPITLLMRKETKQDGSAPLYLYGYGSYGHSIGADFRTNPLSLVDRGFVFAIAHVRGGAEKGRAWYNNGKREKKPNTFTDFIACAEHLIEQKYTSKARIVAHGGSAGGMLMGAIANLRPDLFAGIIAEVPFVDVLNTMLDDTLPLTPPEWPEWGNPITDADAFNYIRAYSPYDNVRQQDYPAIFALGGLTDPRVTYWEPAKWVAKLRVHNRSQNPILLKINMSAGHGGSSGRFKHLEEVAQVYAFALAVVGRAQS